MPRLPIASLLLVAAGMVGCSAALQTPAQLQSRLSAAALITDDWHRDQALAVIAADSARAGQTALCVQAVDQINGDSLRQMVLAASSRVLDTKAGRTDAEILALRIPDDTVRDQVLALLAKTPPPTSSGTPK